MSKSPSKPKPAKTQSAQSRVRAKPSPLTRYSLEICDALCERLSSGESLRAICETKGMPSITSVMRWLADEDKSAFREQYVRAREMQADRMAEDILSIADEMCTTVRADKHGSRDEDGAGNTEVIFDATAVARNRLRVDARKWLASKMAPKKYGDKIEAIHSGPGGGAIAIQSTVTFVRPPARAEE